MIFKGLFMNTYIHCLEIRAGKGGQVPSKHYINRNNNIFTQYSPLGQTF
jgi:hypothetical protein